MPKKEVLKFWISVTTLGRDDVGADGGTLMDGLDQRGLHGGGVGGGQPQGLTGLAHGGVGHTEDVVHRIVHDTQETEQHQHGQQHGQTAGHGIEPVFLLQLHQLFLLLLGVVFVFLLDFIHQRLEHRHLGHGFLLVDRQRKEQAASE